MPTVGPRRSFPAERPLLILFGTGTALYALGVLLETALVAE